MPSCFIKTWLWQDTANWLVPRCNLSCFLGIKKNIQQNRDGEAKIHYCRQLYNYQVMLNLERYQQCRHDAISIEPIISMLEKVVTQKTRFAEELAIRKAR